MSYKSFAIVDSDIKLDGNGSLIMTEDLISGIAQTYKILIETVYGSDFRDPEYGFKLMEFFNSDFTDLKTLLERFTEEALLTHELTDEVEEIQAESNGNRRWTVNCKVKIKTGEIINFTANIG